MSNPTISKKSSRCSVCYAPRTEPELFCPLHPESAKIIYYILKENKHAHCSEAGYIIPHE